METLAYLHLALAYETPVDVGLCERRIDWRKFSSQVWMYLLPVIVTLGVLGMASEILAQTLRQGDRGSQVTVIQERLRQLGYFNQPPNGTFGSVTKDAVSQFQQQNGLVPDGIVGAETEAALFGSPRQVPFQIGNLPPLPTVNLPPLPTDVERQTFSTPTPTTVLQRGDRGPEVSALQERLTYEGFYPGLIDGIYGRQTEEAVRQFQRANSLFPNGVADSATLVALGIPVPEQYRYVVVVPIRNENTLFEVRSVPGFANANLEQSRRGSYVNAGSFPNRASAESRSYLLRSLGLDARVAYLR
jgi:peptidoglycan hydrolase-like protein with peptidoglycan-binding domain